MRSRSVEVGGKKILVQELQIKELRKLIAELLPETGGNLANFKIEQIQDLSIDDILYEKLPLMFPGLTKEGVDDAFPSEIEELVKAFIDVHFLGLKNLIRPLMSLAQAGTEAKTKTKAP